MAYFPLTKTALPTSDNPEPIGLPHPAASVFAALEEFAQRSKYRDEVLRLERDPPTGLITVWLDDFSINHPALVNRVIRAEEDQGLARPDLSASLFVGYVDAASDEPLVAALDHEEAHARPFPPARLVATVEGHAVELGRWDHEMKPKFKKL